MALRGHNSIINFQSQNVFIQVSDIIFTDHFLNTCCIYIDIMHIQMTRNVSPYIHIHIFVEKGNREEERRKFLLHIIDVYLTIDGKLDF